jgi:NAD(P)-dependent dehydrogenase (short-subunit alcohol dehydrogenase family)
MFQLQDQHIVVVGGSSGIGLAVARLAQTTGARVTVMARDAGRLTAAINGPLHGHAHGVRVDVADEDAVKQAFAGIDAPHHVYVAAASFVGGSVLDTPMPALRAAIDVRLWGAVNVVRAAAPRMKAAGASFVLTGGVSTDRPSAGAWPTAVATAATEQLARCLALELAPLRFNAIAPGWTDTPMWDGLLGTAKADTFASIASRLPTGRIASADEAAQAVLLLMSNGAVNAEVLHVDGGHRLV